MWTCPKCGRNFKRRDQQHSCVLLKKEDLFEKKPEEFRRIFQKVVDIVDTLGDYRTESVPPDVIYFKTASTFLAVKVKKAFLEIEFFLDHQDPAPVVSKWLQTSRHRFAHVVPVEREEELDQQLQHWIRSSY